MARSGILILFLFLLASGAAILAVVAVGVYAARAARLGRGRAIPRSELASLGTTIQEADRLAAGGHVNDGLACLVAGLRRAETLRQQRQPWAGEMVTRWASVIDEYATDHRIGPVPELVPAPEPPGRGDEMTPGSG